MARDTALIASSWPTTDACSSSSIRSSRAVSASCSRVTGMPVQRLHDEGDRPPRRCTGRCVWRSLLPLLLLAPDLALQLALLVAQRRGALEVLVADRLFLLGVHLLELRLELGHLGRRHLRRQPRARARLVDHVDRLVRQEPVGDVALRQLRRRDAASRRGCSPGGGPRTSSAGPCRISTVSSTEGGSTTTVWKRRSSAPSFSMYLRYSFSVDAPTHCSSPRASAGLSMLRRVDRAFGRAGADQRVQLVDEQDDVLVLRDLVHDRLEPLLELAAVLGAGDDRRHVERQHAMVAQRRRGSRRSR